MSHTFKSSVWAFSLLLLCSTLMYANDDALGARGRLQKLSSGELEHAKKAYIEKMKAKQEAQAKDAKANALKSKPAAQAVPSSCPSPLPKPHKKCVSAQKVITPQLCATNASIDDLTVKNNATVGGDLSVGGNETVAGDLTANGKIKASFIAADRADFDVETTNVSYEDVNVIEDLRVWQTDRFVTPNYDRFPDGALPQTTKIGPGETYEFTSLSPNFVPVEGNNWNAIVHGIIDFSTNPYGCQNATAKEKLDFYSGASARLFYLMNDFAFSATEQEYKVGATAGGVITTNSTVMPADQQQHAAKAMGVILNGLLTVDPAALTSKDRVTLFNLITMARFYIVAWKAANTTTNVLGVEYYGSPNPANLANYYYAAAFFPPAFLNPTILPVFGYTADGAALVSYARALPGLYKQYAGFLQNQLDVALAGMQEGYYPHVLRNRPFTSAGQSTFGEEGYGYAPEIINLVKTGEFPVFDDPRFLATDDYNVLAPATFEDQLSPDVLFSNGGGIVGGYNLEPFLDMLVEQGVMDQVEADYLQEEARKAYDAIVKPSLLSWYQTLYLDETSPFVRALRLTRYDDFPGEWGYKFKVGQVGAIKGNVQGIVKPGVPHAGETVYIDPLGVNLVIKDANGNPIDVDLKNVALQRDEAAGNEHYTNMAEIVLKINRGTSANGGTPIPYYKKVSNTPNVNPFNNWKVQFDDTDASLPKKLHASGETLVEFFSEAVDFYLNQWVTATYPPCTDWRTVPAPYVPGAPCCDPNDPTCKRLFPTRDLAIAEISKEGRLTADLEDPIVSPTQGKGGVYAFVQHYQPISDDKGPLYDYAQVEAYYTQRWDQVPQLNPVDQLKPIVDRDGKEIYNVNKIDPKTGLVDVSALFAVSQVDNDKANYYRFLGSDEIVAGKSARVYYFFYDFIKHSFEDYMTIGQNPLLNYYFSPYIVDAFNKLSAHRYLNSAYASGSSYDPSTQLLTYTHLINYPDPRNATIGDRTTLLHEFIMGHALQVPLTQMINSTGTGSWLGGVSFNSATAEGWAVFIETFFGPQYTSYLSPVDRYWNYTVDPQGRPDPVTLVPSITNTARVAARLKWDTAVHSSDYKASLAEHAAGFKTDTFDAFDITSEISQRIPVGPTQGLNYGLGFLQIVGLYQDLPNALGQERYDELQANGFKATKYFFDLLLLDAQGYFISSLQPIYDEWALKVKNKVPPFDDPNYEGYPVDAFDAHTVPYVPGTDPVAYEFIDNPYVPGGFTFTFPACPVPNNGTCPSPKGN